MNTPTRAARADKLTPSLGVTLMLVGAFFLFDPFVSVIDLLPDAIGYLLFAMGLYRLADMDERLAEASRGMRRLALLGLARPLALLLAFGLVSPQEQPMFILLALFSLGVLDLILLLPTWKQMREGLVYVASRQDGTALLAPTVAKKSLAEVYTSLSTVYFILREVLVILPEMTVLTHEKGGVETGDATRLYDFVNLFRGIGGMVALVLGLVWLIATAVFMRRLCADKPFFRNLTAKYRAEVLPRHDLFARRAVRSSLLALIAASILSLDLYLDGVNVLPDVLAAALLILSVLFLRRYAGKNYPALITASAYAVTSTAAWMLQLTYFGVGASPVTIENPAHVPLWYVMMALLAVSCVLFVASISFMLRSLYALSQRYTGIRALREGSTYATERTDAIHKGIQSKLTAVLVLTVLTAVSTLVHWGLIPYLMQLDSVVYGIAATLSAYQSTALTVAYQIFIEGYWFVDLVIGSVLTLTLLSATSEISEQMEYSSMMNE